MVNEIYESGQMYLETIVRLKEKQPVVTFTDVLKETKKAKSSVSQGLHELKKRGYIIDNEGELLLTEKGNEVAKDIYDKHKTLTRFFIKLGVNPDVAENDSCKFEHDISDETYNAIKKYLTDNK
jgi:Mn-dependent DtxR family transcriptional regulator